MNVLPIILAAMAVAPVPNETDIKPEPYYIDGAPERIERSLPSDNAQQNTENSDDNSSRTHRKRVERGDDKPAQIRRRSANDSEILRRRNGDDNEVFRRRQRLPYAQDGKWRVEFSYSTPSGSVSVSASADDEDFVAKIAKIYEYLAD
jgi:hypothetical protein